MSEQETYEKGWGKCHRCKTRRPLVKLSGEGDGRVCIEADKAWCDTAAVENIRQRLRIPNEGNLAAHAGELVADLEAARGKG